MSKELELLKLLGIETEITDETDVNQLAIDYRERQAELHKNNPAIMDEEKSKSKKEGEIVATKRFKKTLNKEFGLGLTDSETNEISVEDLALRVKDATKSEVGKDVQELQSKLIENTNKLTAEIDKLKAEKEEVEQTWTGKWKDQVRSRVLKSKFDQAEYIGTKDKLFDYFTKSLKSDGYDIEVDDDGNVLKIMKGGYEALKPDNTAKETIESLHQRYMGEFIKKSNGTGKEEKTGAVELELDKLPPAMQQRLAEMREKELQMQS